MPGKRYAESFKLEALRQVMERSHDIEKVTRHLGAINGWLMHHRLAYSS